MRSFTHDEENSSSEQTFDFEDGNGPVPAHRHKNLNGYPGGWVADSAIVEANVYIGENALIYGKAHISNKAMISGEAKVSGDAQVYGDCSIEDSAQVYGKAKVFDEALVCGDAQVYDETQVYGDCYIKDNAQVYGKARVFDEAIVGGFAQVYEEAQVYGESFISDKAQVYGKAKINRMASISDEAHVYGDAFVSGEAIVCEKAEVFGNSLLNGKAFVNGDQRKFGKVKLVSHEDIMNNPNYSFENEFNSWIEGAVEYKISSSEAERIANLITLDVIDKKFWGYLLKSNNQAIATAIAFHSFPVMPGNDPIPIFISKLDGYQLCSLNSSFPAKAMEYFAQDSRIEVRCFVARNIETPTEVLKHLAEDRSSIVRQALTENPKAPIEILSHLKENQIHSNNTLFTYKNEEEILNWLIKEQAFVGRHFDRSHNPFFTLLQANSTGLGLKSDEMKYLLHALQNIKTAICQTNEANKDLLANDCLINKKSSNLLWQLVNHNESLVRMAVAQNDWATQEVLDYLSQDTDVNVRSALAKNRNSSQHILEVLAKTEDSDILRNIAANPNTPSFILETLAKVIDVNIRHALAKNPNSSQRILEDLAKSEDSEILSGIAKNPNTPSFILESLAKDKNGIIRFNLATNPRTPINILEILARDRALNDEIRRAVACNPSTPVSLLNKLAKSKSNNLRLAVARNIATPASNLEVLTKDIVFSIRNAALRNPNISSTAIEYVFKSFDLESQLAIEDQIRYSISDYESYLAIASNSNTPCSILENIGKGSNWRLKLAVAENPNSSDYLISKLLDDSNSSVKYAAVSNKNLPIEILIKLAKSKSSTIRCAVAKNPHCPIYVLGCLAKDIDSEVRFSVYKNPFINKEIKEYLENDEYVVIRSLFDSYGNDKERCAFILCLKLPTEFLKYVAGNENLTVRNTVARHPDMPHSLLEYLANDKNTSVRNAVVKHPNISSALLDYLAKDESPSVRSSVAKDPKTALSTLTYLIKDENKEVSTNAKQTLSMSIADNSANEAPKDVLDSLINDSKPLARRTISVLALNQMTPIYTLEYLLNKNINSEVLACLVANPKTPTSLIKNKIIALISQYGESKGNPHMISRLFSLLDSRIPVAILLQSCNTRNWIQRYAVALNKNTPSEILQKLANDRHYLVNMVAIENIKSQVDNEFMLSIAINSPQQLTGYRIPPSPEPLLFNAERVAEIKTESKKLSAMLNTIYGQEETTSVAENAENISPQIAFQKGISLDDTYLEIVKILATRTEWERDELQEIIKGMMIDGVLEHINEAFWDYCDKDFIEGYDPIEINVELYREIYK